MAAIPGPWYRARNEIDNRWVYADSPNGTRHIVAKVWSGDDGDYEGTARLIAAAPELLAALLEMRDAFTSDGTDIQHNACRMADAAIQKAGGW